MLEVIFKSIPKMLFEPIAVAAVLGRLISLFGSWKKSSCYCWFILFAILFMIGWRMLMLIQISRYTSILIYPGITAAAYFCFKVKETCRWIPHVPEKCCRLLPWMFLIGLSIASIVKALHCNPYSNYIRVTCSIAAADAVRFDRAYALATANEARRYHYYSAVKTDGFSALDFQDGIPDAAVIQTLLKRYSKNCDVLYFFIDESSATVPLSASALGVPSDCWQLLSQHYQNRRKKKLLRLYRYLCVPERGTLR